MYRERVGEANIERHDLDEDYPTGGQRWASVDRERSVVRDEEYVLERQVSTYVREQPFLWVALDDEAGPDSDHAYSEENIIALLCNRDWRSIDRQRGTGSATTPEVPNSGSPDPGTSAPSTERTTPGTWICSKSQSAIRRRPERFGQRRLGIFRYRLTVVRTANWPRHSRLWFCSSTVRMSRSGRPGH